MIRNVRDKIAKEISKEKGIELIQAQEMIDLFLRLTYEEGYVVVKQEQYVNEPHS